MTRWLVACALLGSSACGASAPPPEAEEPVAPTVPRSSAVAEPAPAEEITGGEAPDATADAQLAEGVRLVFCVEMAAVDGVGLQADVVELLARNSPNDVARGVLETAPDRFDRVAVVFPLAGGDWELLVGSRRPGQTVTPPGDPARHRHWAEVEAVGAPAALEGASDSSEAELAALTACPSRLLGFRVDAPLELRMDDASVVVESAEGRVVRIPGDPRLDIEATFAVDTEPHAQMLEVRGAAALDQLRNQIVLRSLLRDATLGRTGTTLRFSTRATPSQVRLVLSFVSGLLAGG